MSTIHNIFTLDTLTQQILNCVCVVMNEIKDTTGSNYPGCPSRAFVTFGSGPQIELCETDQLTVSVGDIYESGKFPQQDTTLGACAPTTLVADVNVSVTRCVPTMDDNGNAPSPESLTRIAEIKHKDILAIMGAVRCCVPVRPERRTARRVAAGRVLNGAETGGVATVSMTFQVDISEQCKCGSGS